MSGKGMFFVFASLLVKSFGVSSRSDQPHYWDVEKCEAFCNDYEDEFYSVNHFFLLVSYNLQYSLDMPRVDLSQLLINRTIASLEENHEKVLEKLNPSGRKGCPVVFLVSNDPNYYSIGSEFSHNRVYTPYPEVSFSEFIRFFGLGLETPQKEGLHSTGYFDELQTLYEIYLEIGFRGIVKVHFLHPAQSPPMKDDSTIPHYIFVWRNSTQTSLNLLNWIMGDQKTTDSNESHIKKVFPGVRDWNDKSKLEKKTSKMGECDCMYGIPEGARGIFKWLMENNSKRNTKEPEETVPVEMGENKHSRVKLEVKWETRKFTPEGSTPFEELTSLTPVTEGTPSSHLNNEPTLRDFIIQNPSPVEEDRVLLGSATPVKENEVLLKSSTLVAELTTFPPVTEGKLLSDLDKEPTLRDLDSTQDLTNYEGCEGDIQSCKDVARTEAQIVKPVTVEDQDEDVTDTNIKSQNFSPELTDSTERTTSVRAEEVMVDNKQDNHPLFPLYLKKEDDISPAISTLSKMTQENENMSRFKRSAIQKDFGAFGPFMRKRTAQRKAFLNRMLNEPFPHEFNYKGSEPKKQPSSFKPIKGYRKEEGVNEDLNEGIFPKARALFDISDSTMSPNYLRKGKKETFFPFQDRKLKKYKYNAPQEFYVENSYGRGEPDAKGTRLRCRSVAKLKAYSLDTKAVESKGFTFSEEPFENKKKVICTSETSETEKLNDDLIIRHGIGGSTLIAQEKNPLKLLSHSSRNKDILEIGSSSKTRLNLDSQRNSSASFVGTYDKKAESISRTNSKILFDDNQKRAGMESIADIEGDTLFKGEKPLVMTSSQHDAGFVAQNPRMQLKKPPTREDVKTMVDYEKKSNFEIMFRLLNPTFRRRNL